MEGKTCMCSSTHSDYPSCGGESSSHEVVPWLFVQQINCGILLLTPPGRVGSEQNDLLRVLEYAAPHHTILIFVGRSPWSCITILPAIIVDSPGWPRTGTGPAHGPAPPARGAPAHHHWSRRRRQNAPLARGRA